ncbi:hypothetical protein CDV31_004967 [Fusarium ambrosium]|uniref:Aldehyde dehydrogenase domain-containing protein n=1 Tax=Fusarium ambrosium TaxID=131363 RepID=A0A428UMI5_9HYPO|nr:hypothetical protein CDV31_004967 [Fusarium ambrosium]
MASRILANLVRKDLFRTQGYIGGSWVDAASGKTFDVLDPATLDKVATVPEMGSEDTLKAIQSAHTAFHSYKQTTARQRARWLRKWSDLCLENADDLALILCLENGKTLAEAKGEVTYAASFLEWFAGEAERTYGEVVPSSNPKQRILTFKQPLGVAACMAPWNFPIAMITRKCGAALAAGCTTVWKPAGETPLSCLAQAVLAQEAGFPTGCINVITTLDLVAEVGETLCTSKLVRKLSFTGSTRVGKLLASQCSSNLTKLSLELGGNSPFIVFDDADMETAIEAFTMAKFRNSGQTCVTANRVFVQSRIYDAFAKALVDKVKTLKVGPGTEPDVLIGPLTHERAVDKAMSHIKDAKTRGAQVVLGGAPLTDYKGRDIRAGRWLVQVRNDDEVIALANDCDVGLGSFICTENTPRMWQVAEALDVGMVGVNLGVLSACESPFGGVKESGYGREGGRHGIDEYLTVKSMLINVSTKESMG